MIGETMARQGSWLFRWRSYVILVFAPLAMLIIIQPEPVETHFGQFADTLYESACIALSFIGLGIRAFTVGYVPAGTSGRNTAKQVARSLNTTGMYSLTRNPLYFGNAIIYMGVALFLQNIWFAILMLLFLVVYLERIIATEERFLSETFGQPYADWAARVPAFFPKLSGWVPPALPFSLRNVLRREYSGFFGIVATFFVLDSSREWLSEGRTAVDTDWLAALTVGAAIYVLLRSLKKHTRLLHVDGR